VGRRVVLYALGPAGKSDSTKARSEFQSEIQFKDVYPSNVTNLMRGHTFYVLEFPRHRQIQSELATLIPMPQIVILTSPLFRRTFTYHFRMFSFSAAHTALPHLYLYFILINELAHELVVLLSQVRLFP